MTTSHRKLRHLFFALIISAAAFLPISHGLEVRPDPDGNPWATWEPPNDATVTSFTLEYRALGAADWQSQTIADGCQIMMPWLPAGVPYQFRAHASLASGESLDLGSVATYTHVATASTAVAGLEVEITSISAAGFPDIQANVRVTEAGENVGNLNESNFAVREWYTETPGTVVTPTDISVTPPDGSVIRVADIVFVIDDTGSMGGEINSVRNNVQAFANELANRGIDFRLGLVAYKDEGPTQTRWIPDENLIADKDVFNQRVASLSASGGGDGPENGFGGLALGTTAPFRARSQRVFILITDQSSHTRDGVDQQGAIDLIRGVGGVCYVAGPNISQYNGTGSLTEATGGAWFGITSNLTGIIDDIASRIADVYVVRYNSGISRRDILERTAEITVTTPDLPAGGASIAEVALDTATYTPTSPPTLALDDDTTGRLGTAIDDGDPFPVGVNVQDLQPPFVTEVKLFYKSVVAGTFSSVNLNLASGSGSAGHWVGTIPGAAAVQPGLQFYVSASDSGFTVTLPDADPQANAFPVAVLPNAAPVITHVVPGIPAVNSDVQIAATVDDDTEFIDGVTISYRTLAGASSLNLTTVAMTEVIPIETALPAIAGGPITANYLATLPGAQFTPASGGFQYFIVASDNLGVKTRSPAKGFHQVLLTGIDSDNDGLTNGEEIAAGTDPINPDSDNDGLFDGWEVKGLSSAGKKLDLPALGANPLRKDLFVEIDFFAPSPEGISHVPNAASLGRVTDAFANSPVVNPDGSTGITLHIKIDQEIPWRERWRQLDAGVGGRGLGPLVNEIRDIYFSGDLKRRVYRYCIYGHEFGDGGVLGKADGVPSDTFVVTVGGATTFADRNRFAPISFMHELGHTIGLQHGGDEDTNFKPNYVSVMNYSFALKGLVRDGVMGVLDYSRKALDPLAENNLDEPTGIGDPSHSTYRLASGGAVIALAGLPPAVDWNNNGTADEFNRVVDLNGDSDTNDTLNSFDDWAFAQSTSLIGGSIGTPIGTPLPPFLGDEPDESIYTEVLDALTELPLVTRAAASGGGGGSVLLGWPGSDSPSVFFRIYRRSNGLDVGLESGLFELIATLNATNGFYEDTDVVANTSYTYQIVAFDTNTTTTTALTAESSVLEITVSPSDEPLDSDADGLLDPWEVAWRLDPDNPHSLDGTLNDGAFDMDEDGATNLQEMEGRTNPRSDLSQPPAGAFDIWLGFGWNLVSFPYELSSPAADAMFGYSSRVVSLISTAASPAQTNAGDLEYADVANVVGGYGYFIYIPFADGLFVPTYGGNTLTEGPAMHRHWNIIGVPHRMSVADFLAENASIVRLVRWNTETAQYEILSDGDNMRPGEAYFAFNSRSALVVVQYPDETEE